MFILNTESIYIGYSSDVIEKIKNLLIQENIDFKIKVINHSTQWGTRGSKRGFLGNLNENIDYQNQYNVIVKRDDYIKAKTLIQKNINL